MTDLTIQDIDDLAKATSIYWPGELGTDLQDKLAVLRKQIQDDACDEIASIPHGGAGAAWAKRMPVRKSAEGRLRALEVTVTRGEDTPGMKAVRENNPCPILDPEAAAEMEQAGTERSVARKALRAAEQKIAEISASHKAKMGKTLQKPADQPMPEFEPPTPEHVKVEKSPDTEVAGPYSHAELSRIALERLGVK